MSNPTLTLAYWAIRGLGQPIRLLLEFVGAKYEDKRYTQTEAPEFSRKEWFDVKEKIGLDFPNLPYLIDGNLKVSQSNAILRHLARKFDLYGKTLHEQGVVEMLLEETMDFREAAVGLFYHPDFDNLKKQYLSHTLPYFLSGFEKFLGNKKYLLGGEVTVADFPLYEMLSQHLILQPLCLADFPKLAAYVKNFSSLPRIAEYLASERCITRPVNNKNASWF